MSVSQQVYVRYATQEEANRAFANAINNLISAGDTNTVKSPTADFTVGYEAGIYLVDATSAAVAVTLPPAASYKNKSFHIKKIDGSVNGITVTPNGSETIDGNASIAINTQYESYRLSSDGSNWYIT